MTQRERLGLLVFILGYVAAINFGGDAPISIFMFYVVMALVGGSLFISTEEKNNGKDDGTDKLTPA